MLLIGGSYADTANNSFASVSGDGVVADGESGFCIENVEGSVNVTVGERPGWKCEKGTPFSYDHNEGDVDYFKFYGLDDEESVTIAISNIWVCVHDTTNNEEHVSAPGAEIPEPTHMLGAYFWPEEEGFILSVASNKTVVGILGHHTNKVFAVPCPNPKCDYGKKENPIGGNDVEIDPSPVVAELRAPGKDLGGGRYLLRKGAHTIGYNVHYTNDCEDCEFDVGFDYLNIDVCEVQSSLDKYIGLDRTDAGYGKDHVITGSVSLAHVVGDARLLWTVKPHCRIEGKDNEASVLVKVKRIAGNVPGGKDFEYSDKHEQENLCCEVKIKDGCTPQCEGGAGSKDEFTVVKVDVEIDDVNELMEEKEGAFTYYVPDGDAPIWAEEWTNSLKDVSITCEPHDGEMSNQIVRLKFPEKHLYAKNKDGVYVEAKTAYTVEELNKTKFKLHGHEKSGSYKDKQIVAEHVVSHAIDKASFTVFGRPLLVPDYDRKGGIDDKDVATAKEGEAIFRFWINDDDDRDGLILQADGKIQTWQLHKPQQGGNCENARVDGFSDLVDFTPLWLDISNVLPEDLGELKDNVEWCLESDCYKAVWTFQSRGRAHLFRDQNLTTCGPGFNQSLHEATVCELKGGGGVIPSQLVRQMIDSDGSADARGVVMLEGFKPGEMMELICRMKGNGRLISKGVLKTKVSCVTDMIRWMNLRSVVSAGGNTGMASTYDKEPDNRPDCECKLYDRRHFIFVHGYNINKNEALGWACEVFKRLWQSGYRGRFTGVDWYGDDTQIDLGLTTLCPNYWGNVVHAFDTAVALKNGVDLLDGEKVVMAHSLGNMLVCSAIRDEGMTNNISRYYMMNAAVPIQALTDNEYYNPVMIPDAWSKVGHEFMSAHWYELFPTNDFRSKLNWVGRFKELPKTVKTISLYSLSENVVRDNASKPAWKWQETWKGGMVSAFFGCEAGWAQNDYYSRFWEDLFSSEGNAMVARSLRMTESQKITEPLFSKFKTERERLHGLQLYSLVQGSEEKHLRAQILGCCIPATSLCVGANKMPQGIVAADHEYTDFKSGSDAWPRDNDEWHHSDFVVVAYYYITRLYDKLQEGSL